MLSSPLQLRHLIGTPRLTLELVIASKLEGQSTFVVLPRRWIVERTFAWLVRYRRPGADYETEPMSRTGWIYVAAIHRMARRIAPGASHSDSRAR